MRAKRCPLVVRDTTSMGRLRATKVDTLEPTWHIYLRSSNLKPTIKHHRGLVEDKDVEAVSLMYGFEATLCTQFYEVVIKEP